MNKHRILLADPSKTITDLILQHKKASAYEIDVARNGPECLTKVKEFKPKLILIEIMLPKMHGIEILHVLRANPETKSIGIIITSAQSMIQNYHAAIEGGANYFLEKPFTPEQFFRLASVFFSKKLLPKSFAGSHAKEIPADECYISAPLLTRDYIRFWGTRGSNPVSGPSYVRYGGSTCCLEVRCGKDLIIIDAGTGIRPLGHALVEENIDTIHLFFTHTHWDHVTGFPFFAPLYAKNHTIMIYSPVGFEKSTKELFTDMLAYSFFPVRLDEMQARLIFKELRDEKPIKVGSITIECHYTYHPGPTMGFKIKTPQKCFGYITDNELLLGYFGHPNKIGHDHPLLESHKSLIDFLKGCDFLIHEAQYFPREYYHKVGWGHSSISNATVLIKHAGIKEWIVTHHDPKHSDEDLQKKLRLHQEVLIECGMHCHVSLAFDGHIVQI